MGRQYRKDTLILETRFATDGGEATLIDFMPMRGQASDVVRIVVGRSGETRLRGELALRFDYGRVRPLCRQERPGLLTGTAGPHRVRLDCGACWSVDRDAKWTTEFSVRAGERICFALTHSCSFEPEPAPVNPLAALAETERYWLQWASRCSYRGKWRDDVVRSLITVKALICRPSGAVVAAPTSSLSETRSGKGDWDYRFCWLRDATFALLAFIHTGYREEALAWRDWLLRAVAGEPEQLQPVYDLLGGWRLEEWEASWLAGFHGAKPVDSATRLTRSGSSTCSAR